MLELLKDNTLFICIRVKAVRIGFPSLYFPHIAAVIWNPQHY